MPFTAAAFTSGGAPLCSTEARAHEARAESSSPRLSRHTMYSSRRPTPKSRGSSALMLQGTPASSRRGSGWDWSAGTTDRATLDVGQTSRQICSSTSRPTRPLSSTQRTPCWIRSAPSASSAPRTESGPPCSPAWGALMIPAARATAKAGANGSGTPAASSLANPKDTTASPAWAVASVAWSRASSGGRVRSHDSNQPTPTPVASVDQDVENLGVGAEAAVPGKMDGGLDPHRPVGGGVGHHFAHEPDEEVDRPQRMARLQVELLEVGEGAVAGGDD